MISSYGKEAFEILKAANEGKEIEGKNLFTLEQMKKTKIEGISCVQSNIEHDIGTIRQILEVMLGSSRFNEDDDYEFVIESLTMAEEFFSGVLYNGKSFDADSYIKIVNFIRILTGQIYSSYNFLDEMILISERKEREKD